MRRLLSCSTAILMLLVAACGDDGSSTGTSATKAPPEASSPGEPGKDPADDDDDDETATGEVPDPCTLLDAGELAGLLGTDPGTGTSEGPVPDQRKVCLFTTGTILAVEVAPHWDASLDIIREAFGADDLEAVPGVGADAYWEEIGHQFLALGDRYFVGVTGPDRETGQAVAEAMLAAL